MRRPRAPLARLVFAGFALAARAPADAPPRPITVSMPLAPVDVDDDDNDHVAERAEGRLDDEALRDLVSVPVPASASAVELVAEAPARVRYFVDGRPVARAFAAPGAAPIFVQGLRPGRTLVRAGERTLSFRFLEVRLFDGQNRPLDPTVGLALAHSAPTALPPDPFVAGPSDAVRVVLVGASADLPATLALHSLDARGRPVDALSAAPLTDVTCPADVERGLACRSTLPLRVVGDAVDRDYGPVRERSVRAELGGGVVAVVAGRKLALVRVVAPPEAGIGPAARLRGTLRMLLVRERAHGAPPFGPDDPTAIALARSQLRRANMIWSQCGVSFGPDDDLDVKVLDPPPTALISLGCDLGLPASGGELRVRAEGRDVRAALSPGDPPDVAAHALARALRRAGLVPTLSPNPRISPAASASVDVLVRRRDGGLASLEPPHGAPLSSDSTLTVCLGRVDLSDGLQHFSDVDAASGTVEERALLKAFDDGDPATIEVVYVPAFATGGRIGESFIRGDRSSLGDMIVEDRAGVRADRVSFALAHELGHVLLDVPGHTDDFGADTPTMLMDSDAADASPFGPRRIALDDCRRAVRQSGPGAPVALLRPWPLARLPLPSRFAR